MPTDKTHPAADSLKIARLGLREFHPRIHSPHLSNALIGVREAVAGVVETPKIRDAAANAITAISSLMIASNRVVFRREELAQEIEDAERALEAFDESLVGSTTAPWLAALL